MSFSDENRPAVANVYHGQPEKLEGKKTNETIKSSPAETLNSVPKPVGGENIACKHRRMQQIERGREREKERETVG